jgi:transcriptional regulator with XRE-family HTH domain
MTEQQTRTDSPLQALIRERLENTGDTLADIAHRGGLPRQTVSGLLARDSRGGMPRRSTLEALAKGLDLPVSVVASAAGKAASLDGEPRPMDQRLIVLTELCRGLPPACVDVVLATARALTRIGTSEHA